LLDKQRDVVFMHWTWCITATVFRRECDVVFRSTDVPVFRYYVLLAVMHIIWQGPVFPAVASAAVPSGAAVEYSCWTSPGFQSCSKHSGQLT
jgi:hypothetical protein